LVGAGVAFGTGTTGPTDTTGGRIVDFKLELVLIPVSDVDRAKDFYVEKLGCNLDVDHQPNNDFHVVQMTPPGSACSRSPSVRGSPTPSRAPTRGTHLVVTDIEAAREQLRGEGWT
jgi:catechol 2,3-dioxygenase-like lactoylglutathione lyase family enzyme